MTWAPSAGPVRLVLAFVLNRVGNSAVCTVLFKRTEEAC